jgi:hypothetical protein
VILDIVPKATCDPGYCSKATCDPGYCSQSLLYDMDFGENHLMRDMESRNRNSDAAVGTKKQAELFLFNKAALKFKISLHVS